MKVVHMTDCEHAGIVALICGMALVDPDPAWETALRIIDPHSAARSVVPITSRKARGNLRLLTAVHQWDGAA